MRRDPDKAKAWRQRSKPIPRESTKRKITNRERRSVLAEVVHGKACAAQLDGCSGMATDGHELLSRARGGSITDPDNIVPLCRSCHRFVTEHPAWAQEHGWARRREP